MNDNDLIDICLHVLKKGYVAWYSEMFELIKRIDLSDIKEEMLRRLILSLEELLYEKDCTDLLHSGVLTYVRNCDRKNTKRLEEIVKEKYQKYYNDTYLINTCNGDSQVLMSYIDELMVSIDRHNKIQGKNIALFACHGGGGATKFFNNIKKEIPNNKFIGEIDFFEPINNDKEEAMKKAVIWIKELIE